MSSRPSRYTTDAAADYGHRFHAGNVGDVWKHCVLMAVLRALATTSPTVRYVETHAGEGVYALGPTGEWTEGIGRLWSVADPGDDAVARYVDACRRLAGGDERPRRYPGSPLLARDALGTRARLTLWERDHEAFARLTAELGSAPRTYLVEGDGVGALAAVARDGAAALGGGIDGTPTIVLVDPPWTQKSDWIAIPDAVARAAIALPQTCFVLWYPVKSLTRPNAMHARLAATGVAATFAELVTTPLGHRRNRLNGSGVLLIRPPADALRVVAAAAPVVGALCATRAGVWSFRVAAT